MGSILTGVKFPLVIGSKEQFTIVREFFKSAGFSDDGALCRALGIGDISEVGRVEWGKVKLGASAPSLRWCIEIFLHGLLATRSESQDVCGEKPFRALESLGLIRSGSKDLESVVCPAWVYPVDGFVVASDRREDPEGEPYRPPEDVVFPAIYGGTLRFLRLLPATEGEALDLCGGSGIGALHFSRGARVSVTADVAERAALYAEFNARLNGVEVTSLCGDLYTPVAGRQFDIISAHPPFVPATGQHMVYRDGGETGEEVTRRTVEGLAAHLRPEGTCVILCVARDTEKESFEQRVRSWLGTASGEFDVVFGLEKILSMEEVIGSLRGRAEGFSEAQAQQLLERLRSFGTKQFVYGALFIRREVTPVAQSPLRVRLTPEGNADDFKRLLAWRRQCRQPGFDLWLPQSRPRLAPKLVLTVQHVTHERELVPAEFVFSIEAGFQYALRLDGWVVPLIARFDGKRSIEEVFVAGKKAEELPEGFGLEDFAGLVRTMIERGLLEVEPGLGTQRPPS